MNIEVQSKIELIEVLSGSDISVLPRNAGRTNNQVEKWVMYRALSTLCVNDLLEYPLRLRKRERPDFLLVSSGKSIGCEVTEAINGDYLRAKSLPEAANEKSIVDVSKFKWGTAKRSLDELREIVSKDKLTGPAWAGNSVEVEFSQIVFDVANKKTESLRKSGYERFSSNYLLIYCNQTLPILDVEEGSEICFSKLAQYWSDTAFDQILVEKGENIIIFTPAYYRIYKLNDLWAGG